MKKTLLVIAFFWSIMYPSLSGLDTISSFPKESYQIRFKMLDLFDTFHNLKQ